MQDLKVYVVEFGDRANYMLQWIDPNTGKKRSKSSGVKRTGRQKERDAAAKAAGKLQEELQAGAFVSGRVTWESFRERYERDCLPSKSKATAEKAAAVFNTVENILNPQKLLSITPERVSYFQAELRRRHKSEATIKGCLAYLKAALRWAEKMKMIVKAPAIEMPSRHASENMKGRPITGEEFERMLASVESGLAAAWNDRKPKPNKERGAEAKANDQKRQAEYVAAHAPEWRRLLRGLWLSGLRLSEALNLTWDDNRSLRVDLDGKRPMLHIPAHLDKGRKDRLLAITPDFAEFLLATPEGQRRGHVFRLPVRRREDVGKRITSIGKLARVKVGERMKPNKKGEMQPVVKWASAHDLRRSFGDRWSRRLLPQQLMELMRHECLSTTQAFYIGKNAERTADAVWAAFAATPDAKGNTLCNTDATGESVDNVHDSQSVTPQSLTQ